MMKMLFFIVEEVSIMTVILYFELNVLSAARNTVEPRLTDTPQRPTPAI